MVVRSVEEVRSLSRDIQPNRRRDVFFEAFNDGILHENRIFTGTQAYRRLALRMHPDQWRDEPQSREIFQDLTSAHDIFSQGERREKREQQRQEQQRQEQQRQERQRQEQQPRRNNQNQDMNNIWQRFVSQTEEIPREVRERRELERALFNIRENERIMRQRRAEREREEINRRRADTKSRGCIIS